MQRISIERYRADDPDLLCTVQLDEGEPVPVSITDEFAGLIEGIRDDGSRWVMYIDAHGSPLVFWNEREDDGAVVGEGISLQPDLEISVETESSEVP